MFYSLLAWSADHRRSNLKAWSETEAQIHRAFASYLMTRFQRNSGTRTHAFKSTFFHERVAESLVVRATGKVLLEWRS